MQEKIKHKDGERLCRNIYEGNCIVLLGPEFPLEETGTGSSTSFTQLLAAKLREDVSQFDKLPDSVAEHLEQRDVSQLIFDYINYGDNDKGPNRRDLEAITGEYLSGTGNRFSSESFAKLADLPFTFFVNTNYTYFFADCLRQTGKMPRTDYYDFRGNKKDLVNAASLDDLGTRQEPFLYNLFGLATDPRSLVLSENDMVQLIINIISKNPGLPANVKSELANNDKSFLFLGFGFLSRSWYFRILLQVLDSNNKKAMSYALECIDNIPNDEDPTVLFFRQELKLSLYRYDQKAFINELAEKWQVYMQKKKAIGGDAALAEDAPRAFISYKSEDFEQVNAIAQRLKTQGINVWIDRERLQGKWADAIANEISVVDAFVLMQSKEVKNTPVNYVNVEIRRAMERAMRYKNEADFLFPCYLDDSSSVITEYDMLEKINSYDLSQPEKIDQLAKDIKRSYERNKRK